MYNSNRGAVFMINTDRVLVGAGKERLPKRISSPKLICLGAKKISLQLSYQKGMLRY